MSQTMKTLNGYEIVDNYARTQITAEKAALKQEIATERKRIDALASLPEGSTAGDAELVDAHIDYTGKNWESTGAHIRGVTSQLSEQIANANLFNVTETQRTPTKLTHLMIWSNGKINSASGASSVLDVYSVSSGDEVRLVASQYDLLGEYGAVAFFTEYPALGVTGTIVQLGSTTPTDYDISYVAPSDGYVVCFTFGSNEFTLYGVTKKPNTEKLNDLNELVLNFNEPKIIKGYIGSTGEIFNVINDECYIAIYECKPNMIYDIQKEVSNTFRVGYTDVIPSAGVGMVVKNLVISESNSICYETGNDASYLVVYYAYNETNADAVLKSIKIVSNGTTSVDKVTRETLTRMEETIGNITIIPIKDAYISTINNPINLKPKTSMGYSFAIVDCEGGDVFTLSGSGTVNEKLWTFTDLDGNVILQSANNVTVDNYDITAPTNAKKLIVNSATSPLKLSRNIPLIKKYNELNELVSKFLSVGATDFSLVPHKADGTEKYGNMVGATTNGNIVINGTATEACTFGRSTSTMEGGLYYVTGMPFYNSDAYIQVMNQTKNHEYAVKDTRGLIFTADKDDVVRISVYVRKGYTVNNLAISPKLYNLSKKIDSGTVDDETLVKPSSYPQDVLYRKTEQWTNLRWTPKGDVPSQGGASYFSAGKERIGMLYGEGCYQDKRVGVDVSLLTFMTAINNPYSLMYTENTNENHSKSAYGVTYYGDYNSGAYMGMSCNVLVYNVLGCPITYSSFETDGGMAVAENIVYRVYDQSANGVELGDILAMQGHVQIVTRIWRDSRYRTQKVQISEIVGTGARSYVLTATEFNDLLRSYRIYRFNELYKNINYEQSPFVTLPDEVPLDYKYNDDICTFAGDYATFAENDLLHINYNKGSYTSMEIYKNDTLIDTIPIGEGHDVDLTNKGYTYGKYKARLTNGTDNSEYTHWEILDLSLSLNGEELTYSTNSGNPIFWSWSEYRGWHKYKHNLIGEPKTKTINVGTKPTEPYDYKFLKVYVDGDYGRIAGKIEVN